MAQFERRNVTQTDFRLSNKEIDKLKKLLRFTADHGATISQCREAANWVDFFTEAKSENVDKRRERKMTE